MCKAIKAKPINGDACVPKILQQHHEYDSLFPLNASPLTSKTLGLSGSSPSGGRMSSPAILGSARRTAGGGWDDRMGDFHGGDAEQSEAGVGRDGCVCGCVGIHMRLRRMLHLITKREAQVQALCQANLRHLWWPGQRMRPNMRPHLWKSCRSGDGGRCECARAPVAIVAATRRPRPASGGRGWTGEVEERGEGCLGGFVAVAAVATRQARGAPT